MKKLILLIMGIISSCIIYTQDEIMLLDASELEVKIVSVTDTCVNYLKFEELDGPIISIPKSDVLMIFYENGDMVTFGEKNEEDQLDSDTLKINLAQPGSATLYFYRPKKFYGKGGDIIIEPIPSEDIPNIKNGKYYVHQTSSVGVMSFVYAYFFNISPDPYTMTVEDGAVYYLKCGLEAAGTFLYEVDETEALMEIAELKEMKKKK